MLALIGIIMNQKTRGYEVRQVVILVFTVTIQYIFNQHNALCTCSTVYATFAGKHKLRNNKPTEYVYHNIDCLSQHCAL